MVFYIYRIFSPFNDRCYIGSTSKKNPKKRLYEHRCSYRRGCGFRSSTAELFKGLDESKFDIEILEMLDVEDKHEVLFRENFYIQKYMPYCVNKRMAISDKREANRIRREKALLKNLSRDNSNNSIYIHLDE